MDYRQLQAALAAAVLCLTTGAALAMLPGGGAVAQGTCTIIVDGEDRPCDAPSPAQAITADAAGHAEATVSGHEAAPEGATNQAREGPNIIPLFNAGFASPEEIKRAVGDVAFVVEACPPPSYFGSTDGRIIRGTVERVPRDFEQRPALIDALLREGARFAHEYCSTPYVDVSDRPKGDFHYDVRKVSLHGPDGALLVSAELGGSGSFPDLYGDQALWSSGRGYMWSEYVNGFEQRRQEEAAASQRAAQQAVYQLRAEETRVRNADGAASMWLTVRVLFIGALLLWLFVKREAIARWYYLNFDPHPATSLVHRAIQFDGPLDGAALASALSDTPADNRVLQSVRISQAEDLYRSLRAESVRRQEEIERRARAGALAAYERAAYESVKEAVALAAVALERAKNAQRAAAALRRS